MMLRGRVTHPETDLFQVKAVTVFLCGMTEQNVLRYFYKFLCPYIKKVNLREGFPVPHDNFLKSINSFAPCCESYFYFLLIDQGSHQGEYNEPLTYLLSSRTEPFEKIFTHFRLLADINMRIRTIVVGTFTAKKKLTHWHLK